MAPSEPSLTAVTAYGRGLVHGRRRLLARSESGGDPQSADLQELAAGKFIT